MKINKYILGIFFVNFAAQAMNGAKDIYQLHEEEQAQVIRAARIKIMKERRRAEEQNRWCKENEKPNSCG